MAKWLFFDLGSTLIDETDCEQARIEDTVRGSTVSAAEFDEAYRGYCAKNLDGYACALAHFHLRKGAWPVGLERLYPGVPEMLERLGRRYALGIIANQKVGLAERLRSFGVLEAFRVVAGSADVGAAKPDPEIFHFALSQAGCDPRDAVMIGDRLDNDIFPAGQLGMRTVWVRQGYGGLGNPALSETRIDLIVDHISEIEDNAVFGSSL